MGVVVASFHPLSSYLQGTNGVTIVRKFNLDGRLYKMYDKIKNAEIELSLDNRNRVEVVCGLSRQEIHKKRVK